MSPFLVFLNAARNLASMGMKREQVLDFAKTNPELILGGGILLDQGIHMVDLLRYLCGEFTEVKSFISNDFWGFDVEDNGYQAPAEDGSDIEVIVSPKSERLQLLNPFESWNGENILGAKLLIKVKGKCTE